MTTTTTYAPRDIVFLVNGARIEGWGESQMIQARYESDFVSSQVGADGRVVFLKSHDKRGRITLSLQQSSNSNDVLSAIATGFINGANLYNKVFMTDRNGRSLIVADDVFVSKIADLSFSNRASDRSWEIMCPNMVMFVGGHNH